MRSLLLGVWLQARLVRTDRAALLVVGTVPLSTGVLLAIVLHAGRPDLVGHAVLAPALMSLWAMAVLVCADVVESERSSGMLEHLVASPVSAAALFAGRISLIVGFSLLALAESWTTAALVGHPLTINAPLVFWLALAVTAVATVAWAAVVAAAFALVKAIRPLQSTLTFPMYVLSGVMVPVAVLPDVVRPLSTVVYLTWSAGLLRDAIRSAVVPMWPARLLAIAGLGLAGAALAALLSDVALRRLRATGRLGES